jgi:hypothetical protein
VEAKIEFDRLAGIGVLSVPLQRTIEAASFHVSTVLETLG